MNNEQLLDHLDKHSRKFLRILLKVLSSVFLVPLVAPSKASRDPDPSRDYWYSCGTLHGAAGAEWRLATYRNKLVTCGDLVCAIMKSKGREVPSMAWVKRRANAMVSGIDSFYAEPGKTDTVQVSEASAMIWRTAGFDK